MHDQVEIIAILRGVTPDEMIDVCAALVDAGISLIEVPLNSPSPLESISQAAERFAGQALIGAGTVLTPEDVDRVADAKGSFIVSPDCNPEVIKQTLHRNLLSYPGIVTPTEAFLALRSGATGLKFFPGDVLGPKGIKAMGAVLPKGTKTYAVGGANPENFDQYADAGVTGFGLGSYLFKPGFSSQDVAQRALKAVAAYKKVFDQ